MFLFLSINLIALAYLRNSIARSIPFNVSFFPKKFVSLFNNFNPEHAI